MSAEPEKGMTAPELELHAVMSPLIRMLGPLEELQMFPATRALSPTPRCSFFQELGVGGWAVSSALVKMFAWDTYCFLNVCGGGVGAGNHTRGLPCTSTLKSAL